MESGVNQEPGGLNQIGKKIQGLIERAQTLPDPEARKLFHESLHSILQLYGQGLSRILQLVRNAGDEGSGLQKALLQDRLVSSLLLIHGLHPVPVETRLRDALNKIRPYLQSHGGNVEVVGVDNDVARLRLQGTCNGCPSSSVTLELAVRRVVEEACPDLAGLEVEGVKEEPPAHSSTGMPEWFALEGILPLQDGETKSLEVADVPLVVCRVHGSFYAYRNACPACGLPFEARVRDNELLGCVRGHRFDVVHAGASKGVPGIHLEPYPLLVEDAGVRVSVG